MAKLGLRYLWFKLALITGSVLGLLLLLQSFFTYYQASRGLVIEELRREAQRQVYSLGREANRLGREPSRLGPVLQELRQDSPNKIAWVKIVDPNGSVLAQSGSPVGEPFSPPRFRPDSRPDSAPPDVRETTAGRVLVTARPLRMGGGGPPLGEAAKPDPSRDPASRPGHWVEMALYLDSASAAFGPLLTNLILSCSAALGLVASMVLIWLRFPNYVRGKQLEQQTELARQVQMDLLPPADLSFNSVDVAARCIPAWQVGGDFYDVFSTGDGHMAIVVGDVSGKGLPAAVVVGLLLGAVRASSWMGGGREHEVSSQRLSELLRTRTSLERFASMFWCYYEPESRILRYVNAGHLPPLVVKSCASGKLEFERLEEGGPVLGVLPSADYQQGKSTLCAGDLLVMYSDGVVEATNSSYEQFGEERLLSVIQENAARPSAEIRDAILRDVHSFLDGVLAQDDLTLVVTRILEA